MGHFYTESGMYDCMGIFLRKIIPETSVFGLKFVLEREKKYSLKGFFF